MLNRKMEKNREFVTADNRLQRTELRAPLNRSVGNIKANSTPYGKWYPYEITTRLRYVYGDQGEKFRC